MKVTINTPTTTTAQAYRLGWNTDHIYDVDVDAWLRPLPENDAGLYSGSVDGAIFAIKAEPLALPERIEFDAIGPILGHIDYPYTDVMWPIMSKRMLKLLCSLGDFPHRTYPVVMIDCEITSYTEAGDPVQPMLENYDYVAVQLLEHLDVFDYENSVYERTPEGFVDPLFIDKLVFKTPAGGLPPLFRIKETKTDIFVSAEAKELLEVASITGVNFISLEHYY